MREEFSFPMSFFSKSEFDSRLVLTSSIVCGDQYDTVVVHAGVLQLVDHFVNGLVHTSQDHVTEVMRTLLESVFPSFITYQLPELLRRDTDEWSVDCHKGEVEEHWLTLVVLFNDLLGFLERQKKVSGDHVHH